MNVLRQSLPPRVVEGGWHSMTRTNWPKNVESWLDALRRAWPAGSTYPTGDVEAFWNRLFATDNSAEYQALVWDDMLRLCDVMRRAVCEGALDEATQLQLHGYLDRALAAAAQSKPADASSIQPDETQRLHAVAEILAAGLDAKSVSEVILTQGIDIFGAQSGVLLRHEQGSPTLRLLATQGYPESLVSTWQACPVTVDLPVPHALRTGVALYLEDERALYESFPLLEHALRAVPTRAFVALPILVDGRVIAAVGFAFAHTNTFGTETRRAIDLVLKQCAVALDRAFLYEVEKQRSEVLQGAVRMRDEFLTLASHELKTPLTSLWLRAQMLQRLVDVHGDEALTPDRTHTLVGHTERSLSRLVRLVDDMLDMSRLSTGTLTLQREHFCIIELIDEVIHRMTPMLEQAGCVLTKKGPPTLFGNWDRSRLEQVFVNLVSNALKYGAGAPIFVSIEVQSSVIHITVIDHGRGVAKCDHARIFERFERATSAREISGLGLGLYISAQIVELHGGTIELRSELGRGATFEVALPR